MASTFVNKVIRRPVIGILGGVGPMAGVLEHQIIINNCVVSKDQEHLDVMHFSMSQYVPDRTEYLLDYKKNNGKSDIPHPGLGMAKIAKGLSSACMAMGTCGVVGATCNTFHAPLIFDVFQSEIDKINMEVCKMNNIAYDKSLDAKISMLIPGYLHVNHMIELTLNYILNDLNLKTVGLMSTTGTRQTKLYADIANKFDMRIVEVDESKQNELHDSIYNQEDGIKKLSAASERVRGNFEQYVKDIKNKGAVAAILGCTEIPIALPEDELFGVKLVDPMTVLAHTMIKQVNDNTMSSKL